MARDFPNETSPAGKPGVTARQTATSNGPAWTRQSNGTEVKQTSFASGGGKGSKAQYAQKGAAWSRQANGTEYKCC